MEFSHQTHVPAPLPFSPEFTKITVAPPYQEGNDWLVDIEVELWQNITNGKITHVRKHTFPREDVAHMVTYNPITMQYEADWDAIAPLYGQFSINLGPAPL